MNKKILVTVFFTVFIDLLGMSILIPIIPQLLANPASSFYLLPHGWSVGQGYILLGFLTAIYPFMQFLATPLLGELSDRFGRKPVLAISLFGTFLSYIVFAIGIITHNIPLLFISRAFDGITGGNIAVAQAAIADITTPDNRAKNFGLIGAAFGLGFILGPFLGGKLSDPSIVHWFDATTPFWFAAILSLANVILVLFILPETLKKRATELSIHWAQSIKNIIKAFNLPGITPILGTVFMFQGGFTFFTTFFGVFLITRYGFHQGDIGSYFAFVGICIAISQAFLTRAISKRFTEKNILRYTIIVTGVIILCQFIPTTWIGLAIVVPFFAAFMGLSQANITSLVSRSVGQDSQGEILGINASVQALAQTIPPILSGYIAATIASYAPIAISGITIILAGIFFIIFYDKIHSR